jgi:hypothetical protein
VGTRPVGCERLVVCLLRDCAVRRDGLDATGRCNLTVGHPDRGPLPAGSRGIVGECRRAVAPAARCCAPGGFSGCGLERVAAPRQHRGRYRLVALLGAVVLRAPGARRRSTLGVLSQSPFGVHRRRAGGQCVQAGARLAARRVVQGLGSGRRPAPALAPVAGARLSMGAGSPSLSTGLRDEPKPGRNGQLTGPRG